jgi:hypothetical protein
MRLETSRWWKPAAGHGPSFTPDIMQQAQKIK